MKRLNTNRDRTITRKIVAWFDRTARPLPWRKGRKRCAWAALVSEAMLQQTQVGRVVEYFARFMERYPTPADLAAADEQDVLALWQGLGYYRRARHLHQAAKVIIERFGGHVPDDVKDLLSLPGVGRYTAGAIASIAYGKPEPIVDGNVHRVLARLDAKRDAADDRDGLAWTWKRAEQLVQLADKPGQFNEALMELGATLCTPRNPDCTACPLAQHCKAKREGLQNAIPIAKTPAKQKIVHHHAVIIRRGGRILLEQRPAIGLWAGMWQLPTIESEAPLAPQRIVKQLAMKVSALSNGGSFEHHTTHRRITFHIHEATTRARSGTWREPHDLADLPMSNAQRRILREFVVATIPSKPRSTGHAPARSR